MTTRLHHRSKRQFRRRLGSVFVLRVIWTVTIIWAEWIYFDRSISNCRWPTHSSPSNTNTWSKSTNDQPFKLLIIADPQLPSLGYSYPTRIYPLRWLSIKVIDQFIRKSWRLVIRNTHPDAIVFLGDLLDGGIAELNPIKFRSYVNRFYHTFPIPSDLLPSTTTNQSNHTPRLIHLVGNHDVGLYPSTPTFNSTQARERFKKHWLPGLLNGQVEWGNHTIIWLDALSLIEESGRRASGTIGETEGEVTQFINGLSGPDMLLPKLLFTHVPLWRPEGTSCGPLRESSREIRQGVGKNYQNEIPEVATKMILEKIQPSLVFSGDDHDYCEVHHTIPSNSLANPSPLLIQEISVKSFSMGMGVQNPGYHLLTLFNPARFGRSPDEKTTFHKPCFLPNQVRIYTHVYLPLFVISIVVLFGLPIWKWIKKSNTATRSQAKTNGLPIHHRIHRHRKSLSRTLMFTKTPAGSLSSGSSSSAEEAKSDEEAGSARFVTQRTRRSTSLGLGIGLGLDGGEGFNSSSTGMLSYHSPVESGHDDDRFPHPSPALGTDMSKIRRSVDMTARGMGGSELNGYPPPTHHYARTLSSRFQTNDSISSSNHQHSERLFLRLIRLIVGNKLGETFKRWLIKSGIISPTSINYSNHHRSSSSLNHRITRRHNLASILHSSCIKLFKLIWVIFLVYFLILKWFDW